MISIFAGKSLKSRYDSRVAVHLGVAAPSGEILSVCGDKPLHPLQDSRVEITCMACQRVALEQLDQAS